MTAEPAISVVVVSDYDGGSAESWEDALHCLEHLAAQDFDEPVELIVGEWEGHRETMPDRFATEAPPFTACFAAEPGSLELKNAGVLVAKAPLVAVIDADCLAAPGWLRAAREAMRRHPETGAVSGRTLTPGKTRMARWITLAGRSVGDRGAAAETRHIAANNVVYRRDVYLDHPHSTAAGLCGMRLQAESIRRSGHRLYFEPAMEVVHHAHTLEMERDIRRHMGWALVTSRRVDAALPFGWVVRLGPAAIPLLVLGKSLLTAWRCLRYGSHYGVPFYEAPAAAAVGCARHCFEIPGMVRAYRGVPVEGGGYR